MISRLFFFFLHFRRKKNMKPVCAQNHSFRIPIQMYCERNRLCRKSKNVTSHRRHSICIAMLDWRNANSSMRISKRKMNGVSRKRKSNANMMKNWCAKSCERRQYLRPSRIHSNSYFMFTKFTLCIFHFMLCVNDISSQLKSIRSVWER